MTLRMLVYLRYSNTAGKVLTRSSLSALGNIRQERKLAETTRLGSGITEVLSWKIYLKSILKKTSTEENTKTNPSLTGY